MWSALAMRGSGTVAGPSLSALPNADLIVASTLFSPSSAIRRLRSEAAISSPRSPPRSLGSSRAVRSPLSLTVVACRVCDSG
jgi:hypothetical protein